MTQMVEKQNYYVRITKLNKEAKSFVLYSHIGSHVVHFTQLLEGGIHIR